MFNLPALQSQIWPLHQRISTRRATPAEVTLYRQLRDQISRLFVAVHGMTELEWAGIHVEQQIYGLNRSPFPVAHQAAWSLVNRWPPCRLCRRYIGGGCVDGLDADAGAHCPEMPER